VLALGIAGGAITGEQANPLIDVNVGVAVGSICGVVISYPYGCAWGATTAGRWLRADGNGGGAYVGAYIGLLAAVPVALTGTGAVIAPLLPPAGAVIGYNTGAPNSLGARLGLDRRRCYAFDCRLMTVRF
jgi:hypothetical protein